MCSRSLGSQEKSQSSLHTELQTECWILLEGPTNEESRSAQADQPHCRTVTTASPLLVSMIVDCSRPIKVCKRVLCLFTWPAICNVREYANMESSLANPNSLTATAVRRSPCTRMSRTASPNRHSGVELSSQIRIIQRMRVANTIKSHEGGLNRIM